MLVAELHHYLDARVHRNCEEALQPQRLRKGAPTYEGDKARGLFRGATWVLAGSPRCPAGGYASRVFGFARDALPPPALRRANGVGGRGTRPSPRKDEGASDLCTVGVKPQWCNGNHVIRLVELVEAKRDVLPVARLTRLCQTNHDNLYSNTSGGSTSVSLALRGA